MDCEHDWQPDNRFTCPGIDAYLCSRCGAMYWDLNPDTAQKGRADD